MAPVRVVAQFDKEASQTRDYCVANGATHRAARPDPSLRKERLLGMTIKLRHYRRRGSELSSVIQLLLSFRRFSVGWSSSLVVPSLPGLSAEEARRRLGLLVSLLSITLRRFSRDAKRALTSSNSDVVTVYSARAGRICTCPCLPSRRPHTRKTPNRPMSASPHDSSRSAVRRGHQNRLSSRRGLTAG